MDSLHSELSQYKARCAGLESHNLTLMSQVKKLQAQLANQRNNNNKQDNGKVTTVTVLVRKSALQDRCHQ